MVRRLLAAVLLALPPIILPLFLAFCLGWNVFFMCLACAFAGAVCMWIGYYEWTTARALDALREEREEMARRHHMANWP
ncbi:MAG: hypothetical protein ACYS7M_02710 [Planctomycetota bacterium]|jgi:ABC-type dipeptide/oligopeptide/nickel transport system permease subunit